VRVRAVRKPGRARRGSGNERRYPGARAAARTRDPATADSSAVTTHPPNAETPEPLEPNRRPDLVTLQSYYSPPPALPAFPSRRLDSSPLSPH
jgi:hypothetical protein